MTAWSSGIGQLVLGLELHRGLELLGILERRQVHDADDDARVGDTDADLAVEPWFAEHGPQRRGQRLGVGDLAVPDDVGLEGGDRGMVDGQRPSAVHLYGGDGAGLDVEADDGLGAACHGDRQKIGRRAGFCSEPLPPDHVRTVRSARPPKAAAGRGSRS